MARKLGLYLLGCATAFFIGCQSTGSSRLASNKSGQPAMARQATPPQPNFPKNGPTNNSGFTTAGAGYPNSPNMAPMGNSAAFPTSPNITPIGNQTNNPPLGPQDPGTTSNRSNVTSTLPMVPPSQPAIVPPPNFQQMPPTSLPTLPVAPPN